ncbi:MAG: hypothetical protein WCJ64_15555 [Rhodospirillaceae bacterium]
MASLMIKVAGEGLIEKAHRLADVGPTSGSSIVYEITDVPDGVGIDEVIAAFKGYKPAANTYEISFADLGK